MRSYYISDNLLRAPCFASISNLYRATIVFKSAALILPKRRVCAGPQLFKEIGARLEKEIGANIVVNNCSNHKQQ